MGNLKTINLKPEVYAQLVNYAGLIMVATSKKITMSDAVETLLKNSGRKTSYG